MDTEGIQACVTCGQYSHTLGTDVVAEAYMHLQSMGSHGHKPYPTHYNFDGETRDAAEVLMAEIDRLRKWVDNHPQPFNQLTPAEAERLVMLAEECGEVVQAACKVLRHGYASQSPDAEPPGPDNRAELAREVSDVHAAMSLMVGRGDLPRQNFTWAAVQRKLRYAHHQDPVSTGELK